MRADEGERFIECETAENPSDAGETASESEHEQEKEADEETSPTPSEPTDSEASDHPLKQRKRKKLTRQAKKGLFFGKYF